MTPIPNSPERQVKFGKRTRSPDSIETVVSEKSRKSKSPLSKSPKSPKTRRLGRYHSLEVSLKTRNVKNVLSKVCPNSDECLALSAQYMPHINKVFDYFSNFKMLSSQTPKQFMNISSGSNGFTNLLFFSDTDNTYHSIAIMKSAHSSNPNRIPDNLVYEGLAGLYYINEKCYYFPCFVETYGIYKYKPHSRFSVPPLKMYLMNNSKKYSKISNAEFESGLIDLFTNKKTNREIGQKKPASKKTVYNSEAIKHAFENPNDLCILIQSVKPGKTLASYLTDTLLSMQTMRSREVKFILNEELLSMLFQIYSVLSYLSDEYNHNDLHPGNVLIYSLGKKYIKMVYHLKDNDGNSSEVIFYTNKIAKLIDYGRAYVNGKHFKSSCFYQSVCQHEKRETDTPEEYDCDENDVKKYQEGDRICGKNIGLTGLWKQPANPEKNYYISAVQRNKSADLLLLQKLAILFMRYIYHYELNINISGGASSHTVEPSEKRVLDYLDSPIFYLMTNTFSLYRNIIIEQDKTEFTKIIKEIVEYLRESKHSMSKHLTDDDKKNFKLIFDSVSSSFIIAYIQQNNSKLYERIQYFEKTLKQSLIDSKEDFNTYYALINKKGENMDIADKELLEKQTKLQTIWMNRFHINRPMYPINEMLDNSAILSNVDKVSRHLTKIMQERGEPATQEYFASYAANTQYFGELHIYLDGSGRNSHFIAATAEPAKSPTGTTTAPTPTHTNSAK